MKKLIVFCLCLLLLAGTSALAEEKAPQTSGRNYGPGYGYHHMMGPQMMGPGYGLSGMGPGMHRGYGWMHGGPWMSPDYEGWQGMSDEDRAEWRKMRASYMAQTLAKRQELNAKVLELQTLWEQPEADQSKINTLSKEISQLRGELDQERDRFLGQCRQKFGDRGWSCPGQGWTGY